MFSGNESDEDGHFLIILPPSHHQDLENYEPISESMKNNCHNLKNNLEQRESISCPFDSTIGEKVLEIQGGKMSIGFEMESHFSQLVIYLRNLDRFFSIDFWVIDKKGKTNHTQVRIKENICSFPIALRPEWNRLLFNTKNLFELSFKTEFLRVIKFRIYGSAKIWKMFWQEKDQENVDLPDALRIKYENPIFSK
eukprot:snap_masked-scaffold_10-processed-gene-1.48-mRNA-1 protein AED:1.00 eAED:1.00 QI:0/0/0/0/1/1/4/0/194